MALVGMAAPSFEMPAVDGRGNDLTVRLSDYRGAWLVLFFYPHDFTFVCPTEITAFSRAHDWFRRFEAHVLGVSTDSPYVHRAWMNTPPDRGGLEPVAFPLASDWTHAVSRAYGVYYAPEGASYRGLFIVDPEGVVQYEVVHNLNLGRSLSEVQRVLQGLQAGGLCPVDWEPGEALLTPR